MLKPYIAYSLGGLGNQLFVWAFAEWMKVNHVENVVVGTDFLRQSSGQHNSFSSSIPFFYDSITHASSLARSTRARVGIRAAELTANSHNGWTRSGIFQVTKFKETGFPENYAFHLDRPGHQYVGYFQTFKFFEELRIPKERMLIDAVSNPLPVTNESVAVHLRHGDYRTTDSPFGILPESYYIEALKRQMSIGKVQTVKIFGQFDSMSKSLVESLASNFKSIEFDTSSLTNPAPAEAELLLLAQHRRQILSNSSFSWWGSALAEEGAKIAPGKWFRLLPEPNALIPPYWERLEFSWQ